jgi:hypothetical protein
VKNALYGDLGEFCFTHELWVKAFPHTAVLTEVHRQTEEEFAKVKVKWLEAILCINKHMITFILKTINLIVCMYYRVSELQNLNNTKLNDSTVF